MQHNYTNNVYKKNILILGPYPPPLGGVAVHIKRVVNKLKQQNNIVHIFDTSIKYQSKLSTLKNLIKTIWISKPNIVYYHEPTELSQKLLIIIFFKYFFRYKITTIDHDCRLLYNFGRIKKLLFNFIIKRADNTVVIGDTTDKCYIENNIYLKSYSVESPFLPPSTQEEESIVQAWPKSIKSFIKTHSPLISANAFAPIIYQNQDLYGFYSCINLVEELKKTHPNIGVIFGICKVETKEQKYYFEKINNDIKEKNLENNFYFFIDKTEFWPIIKQSDVFVRPTLSDSFGISVQEAVFVGTPAIASDVCDRPDNTILFKTGDIKDFIEKTRKIIDAKDKIYNPERRQRNSPMATDK